MSAALSPSLHPDIERAALLGWRLTPVWPNRAGCFVGYTQAATCDLDQLARWEWEYRGCNWSVMAGMSGLWALDVDVPGGNHKDDGVATLSDLVAKNSPIPARPHGRSGGGGHLMVFKDAGRPIQSGNGKLGPGLDTKAGNNQFTISPSRHKGTGRPYHWVVPPSELDPPVAPEWLLRAVAPAPKPPRPDRPKIITADRARRALSRAVDNVIKAGPGQRNAALNAASFTAGGLIAGGALDQQEAVNALYSAGRYIGLDDLECRATIKSGLIGGGKLPIGKPDA
jgi:hypothetical protein